MQIVYFLATPASSNHEQSTTPTVNYWKTQPATKLTKFTKRHESRERYIGPFKQDYFIVLVCVVILGTPALLFIIWSLVRQANRPERFIFAAYLLASSNNLDANETGGEHPGDIQLSVGQQDQIQGPVVQI